MQKTAIICGDGAIKGGFIAGVFFGLKKYFPETFENLAYISGSSTSVGGLFYELSFGKDNPGKDIWIHGFSDDSIIQKRNFFKQKPVYNIDHIVYGVLKNSYPLSFDNISKSPIQIFFPLLNLDTGEEQIFTNKRSNDPKIKTININKIYDYIRAAISAPFLNDTFIKINGNKYIDAGMRAPFYIPDTSEKNTKKIIITTVKEFSFLEKIKYGTVGMFLYIFGKVGGFSLPKNVYLNIAKKPGIFNEKINKCNQDDNILHIYPIKNSLGSIFDNSEQTLKNNFEMGFEYVKNNTEGIGKFLKITR